MNTYTNDTHKIIKLVQINQMEQYFIKFTTAGKVGGNDGKSDDIVNWVFFVNYSNIRKASHDNDHKLGQISKDSRKTVLS